VRILVTGDKGYIGTVMVPLLIQEGYTVTGLDSDWFEQSAFSELPVKVVSRKKDLRDLEPLDLEGFDAVIHLAGLSNDPLGDLNPTLTYDINHAASVRLAKLAKKAGVSRFLFSSSCSTYGAASPEELLDEQAEFRPVTPYGRSKVLVEQDIAKLGDSNFSPTFLRNATAYGVSPRLRFDLVLNNLVAWALTTGRIYIKSDGTPWRPIVHIEDISRAFIAVLNAPREVIHCEAFNVGQTEENYQIRDLAEIVGETVPGCRIEYAQNGDPTPAVIGSTSARSNECSRSSARDGMRAQVPRNCTMLSGLPACGWRTSKALVINASHTFRSCSAADGSAPICTGVKL
jgi:nucleoside-diphosphate-sugar epimerase